MLSVKERQTRLKYLGYYSGKIDGIEGAGTKKAYLDLQKDYFFRSKDKTGKYNLDTEKLLYTVYNVKRYTKNFDVKKDKLYCGCKGKYCTGYPDFLKASLLQNLQSVRNKYGATSISSALRCKTWNKKVGGVNNSKHTQGKAVDFHNSYGSTLAKRKEEINYFISLPSSSYSYCNGYFKTKATSGKKSAPNMGSSIHGDVK